MAKVKAVKAEEPKVEVPVVKAETPEAIKIKRKEARIAKLAAMNPEALAAYKEIKKIKSKERRTKRLEKIKAVMEENKKLKEEIEQLKK